jgi:hypothetical protein
MTDKEGDKSERKAGAPVECSECRHFRFFENEKDHNTPQSLGRCLGDPWDGNIGQWPMFKHPCPSFSKADERIP